MPYVIFTVSEQEIDRRELKATATVGRASDCDICIRDIMMSRAHCRLEQQGQTWVITDLGSRNGTYINHERVEHHLLREGDVLRMGRTRMTYRVGKFEPGSKQNQKPARVRPVDPNESFAGTVVGFELLEPGEAEYTDGMPIPQPRPREPRGYDNDDVHGLVAEIASSAWNNAQQQVARPSRMQNSAKQARIGREAVRLKSRVSFDLQADRSYDDLAPVVTADGEHRRFRKLTSKEKRLATMLLSVAAAFVIAAGWLAFESNFPRSIAASEVVHRAPAADASAAATAKHVERAVETVQQTPAVEEKAVDWRGADEVQEDVKREDQPEPIREMTKPEAAVRSLLYVVF
ncbi:MAG TPA: FHA domain-containing protein [Tepidisphaeraceae bacterium]|jgi:hypothetical protein